MPQVQQPRLAIAEYVSHAPKAKRCHTNQRNQFLATVQDVGETPNDEPLPGVTELTNDSPRFSIRERLRNWEAENPAPGVQLIADYSVQGAVSAIIKSKPASLLAEIRDESVEDDHPLFDADDIVDLRSSAVQLQAGDLVEVTADTLSAQVLAICLGRFNGAEHFYTNTGKWFTSHGIRTLFTVNNFVDAAVLQPVIDSLPARDTPIEVLNALQDMRQGPSRNTGSFLIRKMLDFSVESEVFHQMHATRLDNASEFLGQTEQYLSLEEIADVLLPRSVKIDGKFPSAALYAVHKTLLVNDAAFRPMTPIANRRSYLYEISSLSDVQLVDKMNSLMRMFYDDAQLYGGSLKPSRLSQSQLGRFVLKAREAIDTSRESRQWSPYGMLSPATKFSKQKPVEWTDSDIKILHFMQLWSSFKKFSRASSLQWIGAGILRAIERYGDSEYLTTTTGWTFLQEIGWVKPWDISSRYSLRLPGVGLKRTGGFLGHLITGDGGLRQDDRLSSLRRDWAGVRAYCIDSASAGDIDDAVSIEWTPEGEQWVHIHVADPASGFDPDSLLAKRAELVPQTAYLVGNYERMLPVASVREKFSLAPNRPCLTFSARVDEEGQIQQYNVSLGILRDVMYMTGKDVNDVCGEKIPPLDLQESFSVGPKPKAKKPRNRKLTTPGELSQQDIANLKALSRVAGVLEKARLLKGGMPLHWPRPQIEASFQSTVVQELHNGFLACSGDPWIKISYEKEDRTPLVDSTMRLAGEIAARWCAERGIPIPYRSQPLAAVNLATLQTFTRDVLYPKLAAGKRPSETEWRTMRSLLGSDELSATPAPHFTMGVSMYTKATSPLRRYSDLLLHWQIEAALVEEQRRGASLVGNTDDDSFLPFSRERLERSVLPMLRVRERTMRALDDGDGSAEWMLQALVRAWRFGEGDSPLPATFRFTVHDVLARRAVRGRLNWFDRPALMEVDGLNALGIQLAELRAGQVLDVELVDVNVVEKSILVRAVGKPAVAESELSEP